MESNNLVSACCTGHRPQKFPFAYGGRGREYSAYLQELKNKIEAAVTERGVTRFISGMALGVDLDFAEIVLEFRKTKYPQITLECAIPCPNQTEKWQVGEKLRYEKIKEQADCVTVVSEYYTPECMLKRNRYMLDKSNLVIAVFNGIEKGGTWYTIRYARAKGVPVSVINLNEI